MASARRQPPSSFFSLEPREKRIPWIRGALLLLCAVLASAAVFAQPLSRLFPQPLKSVDGDSAGVAVADFNNDGHPDVAVPNFDLAQVQVHLGNGDGSFTTLAPFATDHIHLGAASADLNSDGNMDLLLAIWSATSDLSVLMGNGDGTFGPETQYGSGLHLYSIAVGDFNGDDRPDLHGTPNGLSTGLLFLNNGDGTLAPFEITSEGIYVGVADFDGDGLDDYAYPAWGPNHVLVQRSNGDGTFDDGATLVVGDGPRGVTAGDVSGDGVPDLVVANGDSNDISVLLGDGDGGFGPEQRHSLGAPPGSNVLTTRVAIEDLDGDGLQDLLVAHYYGGWCSSVPFPSLSLLYGTGEGQFSAAVPGDWMPGHIGSFDLADFDGDGVKDVVHTGGVVWNVTWLFGDGHGAFIANRKETVGQFPSAVGVDDLDEDGRLDVVTTNFDSSDVSVLLGNGAGTFAPENRFCVVDTAPPCPAGSDPAALALAELTGDNHADLAVANAASDSVSILAGNGAGAFAFETSLNTNAGTSPSAIAIGDLDNDDQADVVVVGEGSRRLGVFLSNGDGTFDPPPASPGTLGTEPTALALGKLDGDGYLDLVVANRGSNDVSVMLGDGDGTFTAAPTVTAGSGPSAVAVGDLNGDQNLDLVVANHRGHTLHVYLGNGDASFGPPTVLDTWPVTATRVEGYFGGVAIVDFDGDGIRDVAALRYFDQWRVFPGNGDGTFGQSAGFFSDGARVALGDFNLDARVDVVAAAHCFAVTLLLNQFGPEALTFDEDGATLVWPAESGALFYDIYRGDLASLIDSDDDGLPDNGYGACITNLDSDARDTFFVDPEGPSPSGAGFFYLMSVIDAGGDGGLGTTSAGLSRVPQVPCP